MLMKSKKILLSFIFFSFFLFNLNIKAEEFNISAEKISIDKKNNILYGEGSVVVTDSAGRVIKSNKVVYNKSKKFLLAEEYVEFSDKEGNIIKTDKATYDQLNNIVTTYKNSELNINGDYKITSNKIIYNNIEKILSSSKDSVLKDMDGNTISVTMFQFYIEKNLFSSVGKIKLIDTNQNKYNFKELHVDTIKKEMVGSEVSAILDQENFGLSKESDPRFVANDIFISDEKSNLSKGVFTTCKNNNGKCPPWSLQAKKISHDKIKKTIYYEHALLKIYDIPIFYFPRFFHPDPTVKRQSGFLTPSYTQSTTLNTGFTIPYFWAISHDRDFTVTPKIYNKENPLLLNEYRHSFKNAFLILDTSYSQGYKKKSTKKTDGSRSHIFAKLDVNLGSDKEYEETLLLKTQRTSNPTYFRVHSINTNLVDSEVTNLDNEIIYNLSKEDSYLTVKASAYENLRDVSNKRYEYVLPNILLGKTFFTDRYGNLEFKSDTFYKNYETSKHLTSITNDVIWNPNRNITKKGFINTLEGRVKNTNYDAKNTTAHKTNRIINEISSVVSFKSTLPMKKEVSEGFNMFSPKLMVRYAPFHMKNLSSENTYLNYANLYSTNKTSEIEDGLSAVLGFDFKTNRKSKDSELEKEKLSLSIGQVFNTKKNKDMPASSSLDQKMSDVVGEINYNFSKIATVGYKFTVDHNFNDLNYNEFNTNLNFGKVNFNLDYLEEQNHVGDENYINTGININLNNNNSLNLSTKKNFKTDSTEFYDISYQYSIDCLAAGLVYRREFYEDSDIEKKNTLMFKITFVPFGGVKSPKF